MIFDGFFPRVSPADAPERGARAGLHEMGLPYVSDPAVTRHLAAFLQQSVARGGGPGAGGDSVQRRRLSAAALRDRLLEVMHGWYDGPGQPWQPLVLTNPSLDLAVAWGRPTSAGCATSAASASAAAFPRSYYIAIEAQPAASEEAEERKEPLTVVCVVPQHLEEGQDVNLEKPELELALGQPVVFPLYTSTVRGDDKAGDVLRVSPRAIAAAAALAHGPARRQAQRNQARAGDAGGAIDGHWHAGAVLRGEGGRQPLAAGVQHPRPGQGIGPAGRGGERRRAGSPRCGWRRRCRKPAAASGPLYLGGDPAASISPQELPRALETALEATRHEWPTGLCRRLWDFLLEAAEQRRQSPAHLTRWYNLVGHCLRPGFGDPLDRLRIEQLWKMLAAPPRTPERSGGPGRGGRGRLLGDVAAGGGRTERGLAAGAVRSASPDPAAGEGQGMRPGPIRTSWRRCGGRQRAWSGCDVQQQGSAGRGAAQAVAAQSRCRPMASGR